MKVKALFLSFCLLLILNLTACTGYNNIMYKHLSNENNYKTYEVAVENIYVRNKETGKLEEYNDAIHDESYLSATIYFSVSELDGFYGGEYILDDGTITERMVLLEVLAENSKILLENDFYKNFSAGNVVEIQSSNLVYMDSNFYYVIGVKYDETQYLNAEDGLQNIVDMMDKDRSLF
ncbi:MAG: hypothetical protein IKA74_06560 [Clostridia bacterium]|nr:hypothetical protein [Clostridia bacterium]